MTRSDKPTKADFKNFWSVFEAKQQRNRQRLLDQQSHPEQKDQQA